MKFRSLDILACPQCGSELKLVTYAVEDNAENQHLHHRIPFCTSGCAWAEVDTQNMHQCVQCFTHEIVSGLLECSQGHRFPIVNGVPRMLPDSLHTFSINDFHDDKLTMVNSEHDADFLHTQKSFSSEWQAVEDSDTAWGKDSDFRKNLFLKSFAVSEDDLQGKVLFDAGCGHGEVEMGIYKSGVEIFAMDLSTYVDVLQQRIYSCGKDGALIHLFQGNVYQPPFKPRVFDMVYSDGVLHHTPDTFEAFKSVSKHVKPGGETYISVYSNETKNLIEKLTYYTFETLRLISTHIPHVLLHFFCTLVSPVYWLYTNAYNRISGKNRYTRRTLRELSLSLFDALSPRYDWHHTTPEVTGWFESLGYEDIRKTVENQNGLGIVGVFRNIVQ